MSCVDSEGGSTCTQDDIRIQGGTSTEGRVEICHRRMWYTICDDLWEPSDAVVACRQLGLPNSGNLHSCYEKFNTCV